MAKDADDVRCELGTDGLRTLCDRLPDLNFKEPAPRRQTQPLTDEDHPPGFWSWPESDRDGWLNAFNARSNGLAGADDRFFDDIPPADGLDEPAGEDLADESFDAEAVTAALTEAGEKAAERLCELLADIPPKNRDPIAMARLIKLAGRLSKVGVTAIKLQIKARDSQLRIVRAGPDRLHGGKHGGEKPVIRIVAGEVSRITDEIEAAVLAANPGLYQRNGSIARIEAAVIAMPDAPKRSTLVIRTQEAEDLREALCKVAEFQKYDRRNDNWITCDPPVQRAQDWIARRERMRLPPLTGVMSSPLILPVERRIIGRPGYDVGTGLFFEPLGASFPPVPEHPTRDDARVALKLLRTLLTEFPFAGGEHGADESVMLSAINSAIMRPAIGNTPLHAFNAPAARTGKSLAATLVSVISQGRAPPLCTAGRTEEELEKRIDALLLESPPFFLIDNIDHPLESAPFASC